MSRSDRWRAVLVTCFDASGVPSASSFLPPTNPAPPRSSTGIRATSPIRLPRRMGEGRERAPASLFHLASSNDDEPVTPNPQCLSGGCRGFGLQPSARNSEAFPAIDRHKRTLHPNPCALSATRERQHAHHHSTKATPTKVTIDAMARCARGACHDRADHRRRCGKPPCQNIRASEGDAAGKVRAFVARRRSRRVIRRRVAAYRQHRRVRTMGVEISLRLYAAFRGRRFPITPGSMDPRICEAQLSDGGLSAVRGHSGKDLQRQVARRPLGVLGYGYRRIKGPCRGDHAASTAVAKRRAFYESATVVPTRFPEPFPQLLQSREGNLAANNHRIPTLPGHAQRPPITPPLPFVALNEWERAGRGLPHRYRTLHLLILDYQ